MSTDNATNITPCARDKKGDNGAREDIAAKQLTLQIEDLSIEKKAGDVTLASTNNADNPDNDITTCAACGKEGEEDSMNICNKCKVAKYCNAACKKKHRHKHKANCNEIVKRAAELHDEELFKQPPPPEDCPICMIPLPLAPEESSFKSCCGMTICNGCSYAMMKEAMRKGKKKNEWGKCAFCRTLIPSSEEEAVEQTKKQMENGNANAFYNFATYHDDGSHGLPQDMAKANELYLKAGELGCASGYYNFGFSYQYGGNGVEVDKEMTKYYWELAAMNRDVTARHNLGVLEEGAGNDQRAFKHYILAASAGHPESLAVVKEGFMKGHVTKDEYKSTLRAYHECQTEMKSEARDAAKTLL